MGPWCQLLWHQMDFSLSEDETVSAVVMICLL